jgi:hypothetical protein
VSVLWEQLPWNAPLVPICVHVNPPGADRLRDGGLSDVYTTRTVDENHLLLRLTRTEEAFYLLVVKLLSSHGSSFPLLICV